MTERSKRQADPCIMLIFGATGDLTNRKLFPALYHLAKDGFLTDNFAIIGMGRKELSSTEFRKQILTDLKAFVGREIDRKLVKWFEKRTYYAGGDFNDNEAFFGNIKNLLGKAKKNHNIPENYFYYLAVPPSLFANVIEKVCKNGLGEEIDGNWRRFILEKPFGNDMESAKELNAHLLNLLDESQVYRIDHYLGKETVQNILVFRFGNSIFEPIWNRNFIDHIQITVAERIGVEKRGGYYDQAGALRDMIPNHIFQLITLTAMEPPVSFEADAVRDEQAKILQAIQPYTPQNVLKETVRGQYDIGEIDGENVPSYRSENSVSDNSDTETYAALKLSIDNWRWAGIPFYVRTGKRMPCKNTAIVIQFKKAPFVLFRDTPIERLTTNRIVLHIQPKEGITLHFGAKMPGPLVKMGSVDMEFDYSEHFDEKIATGYERLLFDCMVGDATLFRRADMVEAGWQIVSPILDVWDAIPARDFPNYKAGSWGPKDANDLIERDGRRWKNDTD